MDADGSELRVRKKLPHEIPPWVDERSYYFITICCDPRGLNQLCRQTVGQAVIEAVALYHRQMKWHCLVMLLMPDHLHGILCFPRLVGMRPLLSAWKRYLNRSHGIRWQSGFFDHRLRDRFEVEEKVSYVMNNPPRKGLCAQPEEWKYVYRPGDRLL